MSMIVNRRDLDFLMYEVFDLVGLFATARYANYDRSTVASILDAAQEIAETRFLPFAAKLDAQEPTFDGSRVEIIPEVADALAVYREAGFFSASFDHEFGGEQLPFVVSTAINGLFSCANCGASGYATLTVAAASMLSEFGSTQQKQLFLQPMLAGRWFGTMCLSEPQAGSSLSDIRTAAVPSEEGHYLISGTKMWISGGDHELSENIVHMVLAKIPGGPPGVKGISLFVVPKHRVGEDASIGECNDVKLVGLNHKMGYRGTTNTLLNFGEDGECHGYLVGEPHQGLRYMFHMMNEMRISVGHGATMSALAGYLHSLDYARNRPQGRHPQDKNPATPQVMIVEHADIRRLLLAQKAAVEGALSLVSYCAFLVDRQKATTDHDERAHIAMLLDLLTPIAKSWPSEFCLEANKHAIQVLGGYGYTRDFPVERFYRDNRLNLIHEGTHAIHGIDLLGRKVRTHRGAALAALVDEIEETISVAERVTGLNGYAGELLKAVGALNEATEAVVACEDSNVGLANATSYLDAFGHVLIGWMWLRQAIAAIKGQTTGTGLDQDFYEGKLIACRYFFRYELPKVYSQFQLVASLENTCLRVSPEHFVGV